MSPLFCQGECAESYPTYWVGLASSSDGAIIDGHLLLFFLKQIMSLPHAAADSGGSTTSRGITPGLTPVPPPRDGGSPAPTALPPQPPPAMLPEEETPSPHNGAAFTSAAYSPQERQLRAREEIEKKIRGLRDRAAAVDAANHKLSRELLDVKLQLERLNEANAALQHGAAMLESRQTAMLLVIRNVDPALYAHVTEPAFLPSEELLMWSYLHNPTGDAAAEGSMGGVRHPPSPQTRNASPPVTPTSRAIAPAPSSRKAAFDDWLMASVESFNRRRANTTLHAVSGGEHVVATPPLHDGHPNESMTVVALSTAAPPRPMLWADGLMGSGGSPCHPDDMAVALAAAAAMAGMEPPTTHATEEEVAKHRRAHLSAAFALGSDDAVLGEHVIVEGGGNEVAHEGRHGPGAGTSAMVASDSERALPPSLGGKGRRKTDARAKSAVRAMSFTSLFREEDMTQAVKAKEELKRVVDASERQIAAKDAAIALLRRDNSELRQQSERYEAQYRATKAELQRIVMLDLTRRSQELANGGKARTVATFSPIEGRVFAMPHAPLTARIAVVPGRGELAFDHPDLKAAAQHATAVSAVPSLPPIRPHVPSCPGAVINPPIVKALFDPPSESSGGGGAGMSRSHHDEDERGRAGSPIGLAVDADTAGVAYRIAVSLFVEDLCLAVRHCQALVAGSLSKAAMSNTVSGAATACKHVELSTSQIPMTNLPPPRFASHALVRAVQTSRADADVLPWAEAVDVLHLSWVTFAEFCAVHEAALLGPTGPVVVAL